MSDPFGEMILRHAEDDRLAGEMGTFYADLDQRIAARRPVCRQSGVCCRFDSYGHRLYVTGIELAYFVRGLRGQWRPPEPGSKGCPYQIEGICTAREHRPMGCRLFFCDSSSEEWQHAEYEDGLTRLKALSFRIGADYQYIEWLSALDRITLPACGAIENLWAGVSLPGGGIDRHPLPVIE
ncbi:MAG: hypothetical protein ACE5E1_06520 [Phycisphaerae bacterium]